MLSQKPEVLFGAGPAQQAEGVLFIRCNDQVHTPYFTGLGQKHPKHLIKPADMTVTQCACQMDQTYLRACVTTNTTSHN